MLTWLHFGDLHVSADDGWASLADFEALIAEANRGLAWTVDFAYLPGDIANHGTPEQYARVRAALGRLDLAWRAVPGDHDFEPGSLRNFYGGLDAPALPACFMVDGRRCLFLDLVSGGRGGPDFRLGARQTGWLRLQLQASRGDAQRPVVFMHAFPGDLAEDAHGVGALFAQYEVACVDTGHTHYNEVLNDGRVIYAATRSTGQIEEGPAGFSLHAVDGSVTSWRFKALATPWPFVLITSPADRRLVTDPTRRDQVPGPGFSVRAKVFGEGVTGVFLSIGDRETARMAPAAGATGVWTGEVCVAADGEHRVRVRAVGPDGAEDTDQTEVLVSTAPPALRPPLKDGPGHDRHSIGAWAAHGVLGSQLGPNKNGKTW